MSRTAAVVAGVLALAAAGTVAVVAARSQTDTDTTDTTEPVATAQVSRRDLVIYDETTATLGFTTSVTVSSPVAGTVTSVIAAGDHVDPGTVVATVDGAPVVAMLGDVPNYRDLSRSSVDGIDVRQLESNLVLLGFDPYGEIVIDEEYDRATAAAVTLWEDSLGLEGDGEVAEGQIVYVPGNLLVAGRCASMTHEGQSAARVSGACFAMGEAAGNAAAMALARGVAVHEIDPAALRAKLAHDGAFLGDAAPR